MARMDAEKSVKYIPATHINEPRAVRSRGGARILYNFPMYINEVTPLTSRQGAFSYNPGSSNTDASATAS